MDFKAKIHKWHGIEKVSAASALYSLGEADYRTRRAVANLISGFITNLKEETRAVSSSLQNAIEALESD